MKAFSSTTKHYLTFILFVQFNFMVYANTPQRLDAIALSPHQKVDQNQINSIIKEAGAFSKVTVPAIIAYLPPKEIATGTSLLVCPGGGYHGLAWRHHVENLAPLFTSKGIAVIGLRYRTVHSGNTIPDDPLKDFNQAIKLIRSNAPKWNLDTNKIVGLGFSAGANLLLQYACQKEGEKIKCLNFLCLWPYFKTADSYKIQKEDLDVILFTSGEDKIAPPQFSVDIAEVFKKSSNQAQVIQYPKGSHMAFNIYYNGAPVDWTKDFYKWLKEKGLLNLQKPH
jgi:predicted esterase